jgi:hypothetical protein
VHALVWLCTIAFRGLACAENGESCMWHAKPHELANAEATVAKTEPALQRVERILHAVARKVDNGCIRQRRGHVRNGGCCRDRTELDDVYAGVACV